MAEHSAPGAVTCWCQESLHLLVYKEAASSVCFWAPHSELLSAPEGQSLSISGKEKFIPGAFTGSSWMAEMSGWFCSRGHAFPHEKAVMMLHSRQSLQVETLKPILCPEKVHRRGAAQYLPESSLLPSISPVDSMGIFPLASELWDCSSMSCCPDPRICLCGQAQQLKSQGC